MSESPASEPGTESVSVADPEATPHVTRRPGELAGEEYRRLRSVHGRTRAWAKVNPDRFRDLQRSLEQAGMATTYDVYVARCVRYGLIGAGVGLVLGALIALVLASVGVFSGLTSPFGVEGGLVDLLRTNKVLIATVVSAVIIAILTGLGTFFTIYNLPRYRAGHRRRNIDFLLPHGIVYMYALSHGGMNLIEVVDNLADSEDAYGEVANEFDAIRRDVELFGNDLMTALQNRRDITLSEGMERFLDDLVTVLDTGGSIVTFLENSTDTYLERADEEQEGFLNTIAVSSEVYVSGFVAAPLFLVVVLMVMSFLGASTLGFLYFFIYFVFPVGMVLFLGMLIILSAAYQYPATKLSIKELEDELPVETEELGLDDRYAEYRSAHWGQRLRDTIRRPFVASKRQPLWTLGATIPLAIVFLGAVVLLDLGSLGAMHQAPTATTSLFVIYPLFIITIPLTVRYELNRSREQAILDRLPGSLHVLASANKMGIRFPTALGLLSRYSTGTLATEFRLTRNDLLWSGDLRRSLLTMANRIEVPQLTRTMKLVADGARSSGELSRILSVAAKDARDRQRIQRKRRREMSAYLAVVIIGFLVYLVVVIFLDVGYLGPLEQVAEDTAGRAGPEGPVSLINVPTQTYRMLLFHSVIIQAVGTGLIAGKLANDSVLSGLKYSIVLTGLALVIFTLI